MKKFAITLAVCLLSSVAAFAQGRVRVVHASPDAPRVDIRVNGNPALDAIPFGSATQYVTLPEGTYRFGIYVAGTDTQVTELSATIERNQSYSVIAAGFATGNRMPGFRVIVLPDTRGEEPGEGMAYLRVVHASPSTPPVDIYVGASEFETVQGRMPLLSAFPFGVATGYTAVPAGDYYARITAAGSKGIALDSGRVTLPSRGVRTAIALDGRVMLLVD